MLLQCVDTLVGWTVVLIGLVAIKAIDLAYHITGRLDDGETEHWD